MKTKGIGVYFIILALVLLAMWWMTTGNDYDNTYNYTNFIEDLKTLGYFEVKNKAEINASVNSTIIKMIIVITIPKIPFFL